MKKLASQIVVSISTVNSRTVKIALLVISLTAFVLGAGAPEGDGGIGL